MPEVVVGAPLIYLVGASGSGKDSLMHYARQQLGGAPGVCFAHRYITRPAEAGGENHVALTSDEFATRLEAGLFALNWESHGLSYGIGIEINQWLGKGVTVVVNGSRAYLPEALQRYPELLPVWVDVSPDVLRRRLLARGRESAREIECRLERHRAMPAVSRFGETIRNDGELEAAGKSLISLIRQRSKKLECA